MTPPAPESDQGKLRAQQDGLWNAVIKRYEDGETWRYAVNLFLVGGGGALGVASKLPGVGETAAAWLGGIGLVMVFIGAGLVAWFERKRADLTRNAKDSLALAQKLLDDKPVFEARIAAADALDRKRLVLLNAIRTMQETAERMPLAAALPAVIAAMLDAGKNGMEGAIGFDAGEQWNFSIFQRVQEGTGQQVMRRIAMACADGPPEIAAGRDWNVNEGYTGAAWGRNAEEIEPDVRAESVRGRYQGPPDKQKAGDAERYVSIAVIPIRVRGAAEMWGTVTATSNQPGRWTRVASNPSEQNVIAVRMLAQMIAMQVALREG
jgi:hypothetical protein